MTGGTTPTQPDLAALRDALNSLAFVRPEIGRAYLVRRELRTTVLREGLAVLALVDTLQDRVEMLEDLLADVCAELVPPAEKKQP